MLYVCPICCNVFLFCDMLLPMSMQEDPNASLEDLDKPGMDEEPIGVQPR